MTPDFERLPTETILKMEEEYELPVYPKRGLSIVRGSGAKLYDAEDNEYIDLVAGIGVANIGHSHPKLVNAITTQASRLITCPEIFSNDTRSAFLEKLDEITPPSLDKTFLCNSGTEASEAAIKFARATTGRTEIITCMRGFHGRTMGALSGTFNRKYRKPFGPLVPGFKFVPFNNMEKLEAKITEDTAGIMIEVIQGNGGIHIAEEEYIKELRQLCNERDILLIIDEVQTGFCRTGTMFAFQQYGIAPDILTLAKSIGGGVPLGACMVDSTKVKIGKSLHGSTFGGNPLAAAAGLQSIEIMQEEALAERANELGAYFLDQLKTIETPLIRDIRQRGLMIGVELRTRVYSVLEKLQQNRILAGPAGSTVIRILPPLVITKEEIDQVITVLREIFDEMSD